MAPPEKDELEPPSPESVVGPLTSLDPAPAPPPFDVIVVDEYVKEDAPPAVPFAPTAPPEPPVPTVRVIDVPPVVENVEESTTPPAPPPPPPRLGEFAAWRAPPPPPPPPTMRYEIEVAPVGTVQVQAEPELNMAYRVVPETVPVVTVQAAAFAEGTLVRIGARRAVERSARSHLFMG